MTTETSEAPARRVASFAAPTRAEGRTPPAKVQPIRPLPQAAPPLAGEDELELPQYPPWRAQLKERVRQVRERRQPDEPERRPVVDETQLNANPLVKSALKRLQRSDSQTTTPTRPRIVRRSAQANNDEPETPPAPEPKPIPKPELKPVARVSSPPDPSLPRRADLFDHQQPAPAADERAPIKRAEGNDNKILPLRPTTPAVRPMPARAENNPEPTSAPPAATETASRLEPPQAEKPAAAPITLPGADKQPSGAPPEPSAPSASAAKPDADADAATITPPRQAVASRIISLAPTTQAAPEAKLRPFVAAPARAAQTATLWVRTLAGACDFEVVCAAYLPLFAVYATLDTSLGSKSLAVMVVLLATITFSYQMLMLTIAGRTFGMAMLKLQLFNRDAETRPPTRRQLFNRALGATVAFLCPPLNLLVMYLNHERRSLPDLCSQTTIIES